MPAKAARSPAMAAPTRSASPATFQSICTDIDVGLQTAGQRASGAAHTQAARPRSALASVELRSRSPIGSMPSGRSRYPPAPFVEFAFARGARVAAPQRLLARVGHPHPPPHDSAGRTFDAVEIDPPPVRGDRPVDHQLDAHGKSNEKRNAEARFNVHWSLLLSVPHSIRMVVTRACDAPGSAAMPDPPR